MTKPDSGAAVEHEDPALDEKEDQPQPDVKEKPEAEKPKPDAKKEDARDDGPAPGTPRWNEIYGKLKASERKLEERDKDVDAIREHNRMLEARLQTLETTKADRPPEPEPDPAVDPDAYKKWHEMKRIQDKQDMDKQRAIDKHEMQVDLQKELHPDYLDVIKEAERDMARDPELKKKIWGSPNPAKAAYKYGEDRRKELEDKTRDEESREKAKKQTETETTSDGSGAPDKDEESASGEKLSEAEVRVIRNLFGNDPKGKEKYLKQKKAMGR